jgi:hypothetical protein
MRRGRFCGLPSHHGWISMAAPEPQTMNRHLPGLETASHRKRAFRSDVASKYEIQTPFSPKDHRGVCR